MSVTSPAAIHHLADGRRVLAVTTRRYTAPVLLDTDGGTANAYRVTGTPTVYLLDRRLYVIGRAIGRRDWASEEARRLLAGVLGTAPGGRP